MLVPRGSGTRRTALVVAGLTLMGLTLRLVAVQHGLPMVYNPDEALHFVPQAVDAAGGDWDPGYFQNPSGLTYLLAVVFLVVFRGDAAATLATDPTAVWTVARVVVAILGAALIPVVNWAGRRFFDERAGLVAAAVTTFAFLPVHYGHQAVNDVVTLLPVTVALVGCLRIVERGDLRAFLIAGGAIGIAGGVKYLAAPMALVVVLAVAIRVAQGRERVDRAAAMVALAGVTCLLALVATNPYLVLDLSTAVDQLTGQSTLAGQSKLGQGGGPWLGYPTTLLWGIGVLPVLVAAAGIVLGWRPHRPQILLLVTFPVLLFLFLGTQDRFFARWLLPAYPALLLLVGYGATRIADAWRTRGQGLGARHALPIVTALVLAQPVADSVRNDIVLLHTDTRAEALAWIHAHVEDRRIVVEPAVPGRYLPKASGFIRWPVARPYQGYETTLEPALVDAYRAEGFCWVMVNSHQRDRGVSGGVDDAIAYYERLEDESTLEARFSPYRDGWDAPAFSYDLSFNWWSPAYERPGPEIELRRLTDCLG